MIVVFGFAALAGFSAMVVASRRAVGHAEDLVTGTRLPPFFVGMTLLAIGTDLPEIAGSIAASVTDHGDVNVGDSIGSAATQVTLVLGLLPLLAGPMAVPRRAVVLVGGLSVAAMALVLVAVSDHHLGRLDALVLVAAWVAGSVVIHRHTTHDQQLTLPQRPPPRARAAIGVVLALGAVGAAALVALWGLLGIAGEFDVPELVIGFFVASLGTSMPELVVDLTALRRGAVAMAVGDIVGSSFVDASLSIAAGPLIAPTDVTRHQVIPAVVAAMVVTAVATTVVGRVPQHDWRTGTILVLLYAGLFAVV